MVLLVMASLTNVVGYQTVQSRQQNLIKERINQRVLIFQTICDIAKNKEIQRDIFISHISGNGIFYLLFGLIIIDGVIKLVEQHGNHNFYFECRPVEKVTVIGFVNIGDYYHPLRIDFYMKTFTDVFSVSGKSHRILSTDEESQHFSLFVSLFFGNGVAVDLS